MSQHWKCVLCNKEKLASDCMEGFQKVKDATGAKEFYVPAPMCMSCFAVCETSQEFANKNSVRIQYGEDLVDYDSDSSMNSVDFSTTFYID